MVLAARIAVRTVLGLLLSVAAALAGSSKAGNPVPALRWKVAISGHDDWVLRLAVGKDATIYAATWTGSTLRGLAPDGTVRRKLSAGNSVHGLAVAADGRIYVASGYDDPQVHVFAPDGSLTLTFPSKTTFEALAEGPDGIVYAASSDGSVYALRSDGSLVWDSRTAGRALVIGRDGTIYTGGSGAGVLALASNGAPRGGFKVGSGGIAALLIGRGGLLYVGSQDRTVYALDPKDGANRWSFNTRRTPFGLAEGDDGTLYVGSFNGNVYALDSERGTLRWRFSTGNGKWGENPVHAIAVGRDGVIYAASGAAVEAISVKGGRR